jgi:hypothetical protein
MNTKDKRKESEDSVEREFETMSDELFKFFSGLQAANAKRTFDEFQQESLETTRQMRNQWNTQQGILNQAMQNAVTASDIATKNLLGTLDMISKQSVRHGDIAIDRQWNVDEQSAIVEKILEGMGVDKTVLAKVLAEMAKAKNND